MYSLLASIAALLIALMVHINGGLIDYFGIHLSSVIIHLSGLIFITFAALGSRNRFLPKLGLSRYLYTGGFIGYFTTLFNLLAIGKINISSILALSLMGQVFFSLFVDQFGLFGMKVRKFNLLKFFSLLLTSAGIYYMLRGTSGNVFIPVIASILSGFTVVLSRQINSELSEKIGVFGATWTNYLMGLIFSFIVFLISTLLLPKTVTPDYPPSFQIFLGGAIGSVIVILSNICVSKMSSFIMTLLMFAGQVFGGLFIDSLVSKSFSFSSFIGGVFAFLGLFLIKLGEKAQAYKD